MLVEARSMMQHARLANVLRWGSEVAGWNDESPIMAIGA